MGRKGAGFGFVAVLLAVSGCGGLPRDARGWSDRVLRDGVLPVGVSQEKADGLGTVAERERATVEAVAHRLNARVEWRPGNAHQLLRDLEEGRIPLVAAQVSKDSPFAAVVGLSRPYLKKGPEGRDYCLAVAPGENRLLLTVDQTVESLSEDNK
jgi:hypothetical protein